MQEKIIEFLKKNKEYVSGEQISDSLNISRQALWKHIQGLKDSGYDIAAIPHLGYRLDSIPDRLYPSEVKYGLNTKFIGKNIYYFDSLLSTMDEALRLALKGEKEGALVVAETQTKGRGRMGRVWSSAKYKGIYMSLILTPQIMPNQASILTLLTAVSVCEAVRKSVGVEVNIKWPNDILIGNKKLAGILTELDAELDAVRFIIIGIGINVNNDSKASVPGGVSLSEETGEVLSRVELLQAILRSFEENYLLFKRSGPGGITEKWRRYNSTLGKRVKVSCHHKQIEGEASDIDSDGALLLRSDSGILHRVTSGDVVHCR